eukprot:gene5909-9739_t
MGEKPESLNFIHTKQPPSKRYGHACTMNKDQMYIFGGDDDIDELNDLYSLDLKKFEWKYHSRNNLSDQYNTPPELSSSRSFFYKNKLYIHGGYSKDTFSSNLYSFDFEQKTWSLMKCKNKPKARSYHSGIVYKNFFVIFGGFVGGEDDEKSYENDVFYLNIDTLVWEDFTPQKKLPTRRSGHTANLWKNEMIIFGGFGDDKCLDDLYSFHLIKKEWNRIQYFGHEIELRYCHTSTLHMDNLWIFGGSNGRIDMKDLICLNLINFESKLIETNLFSVSYHSTILFSNSLIIFGGDSKDEEEHLKNDTWSYKIEYLPPFVQNVIFEDTFFIFDE